MQMNSWYKSFAELNAAETNGLTFRLHVKNRRTSLAVIAPHGGGIEPGTSEIAKAIAGLTYSLYTFDGIRLRDNELLHITSTLFDEPKCINLAKNTDTLIAIHGCSGSEQVVYVGGLNSELGNQIINGLGAAGFNAVRASLQFLGNQTENICNRGRSGQGVQLEITEGLRSAMFKGLDREGRRKASPLFWDFVYAIRSVLPVES
jgi:phage replication-related protein YjqB (UPF0714/DUF867 family)